jgi:hypothetical protein
VKQTGAVSFDPLVTPFCGGPNISDDLAKGDCRGANTCLTAVSGEANGFQSVFERKPAPDAIRGGNRFALRKRVKSRIWSPVSIQSKRKRLQGELAKAQSAIFLPSTPSADPSYNSAHLING